MPYCFISDCQNNIMIHQSVICGFTVKVLRILQYMHLNLTLYFCVCDSAVRTVTKESSRQYSEAESP